jgi:hypothetical protein
LEARFGSGFDRTNVIRMVTLARAFPDQDEVSHLAQRLSWSHLRDVLTLKSDDALAFYVEEAASKHLSVRELRAAIARKAENTSAVARRDAAGRGCGRP